MQAGRLTASEARIAELDAALEAAGGEVRRLAAANYQLQYHLTRAETALQGGGGGKGRGPGDGIA